MSNEFRAEFNERQQELLPEGSQSTDSTTPMQITDIFYDKNISKCDQASEV